MIVGILGTGRMGGALARTIVAAGEQVLFCSARPVPSAAAVSVDGLLRCSDIVLLAVPFPVAVGFASGPAGRLGAGRTLIDTTNPGQGPMRPLPPGISGGEVIAEAAAGWRVAKAFNTIPADQLGACRVAGAAVTVPIAGPPPARAETAGLAQRMGFDPLDAGGIEAARLLESLAVLLMRVSAEHRLHGRIGIHIGRPERPSTASAPAKETRP
jgi:8-hydroxy-5-deazaflavin:NADPH oxidoreductase